MTAHCEFSKDGWSKDPVDICWMACSNPGFYGKLGGWETVLCNKHIQELHNATLDEDGIWRKVESNDDSEKV